MVGALESIFPVGCPEPSTKVIRVTILGCFQPNFFKLFVKLLPGGMIINDRASLMMDFKFVMLAKQSI